jgi:hypothetical protein
VLLPPGCFTVCSLSLRGPRRLGGLVPVASDAVFALGGEKLGPGNHLRVLLEQRSPLTFGHSAPDAELDFVVESVGGALGDDGTVSANRSRFPLLRSPNEHFVGISRATPRL